MSDLIIKVIITVSIYLASGYSNFNSVNALTNESCVIEKSLALNASIIATYTATTKAKTYLSTDLAPDSLKIDLDEVKKICYIDIGWLSGQKAYSFRLSASNSLEDNYHKIFSGKSISTPSKLQRVDFPDTIARILKITLTGGTGSISNLAIVNVYSYHHSSGGSKIPSSPNLRSYDDFENRSNTESKWVVQYTGYGRAGIREGTDGGVYSMYPRTSTNPNETHAVLVRSTNKFSDFKLKADVMTEKQLRENSPPNPWEVAWIFFRYSDTFHYYWFSLKPNGIELGKKSCNRCNDPVDGQIILFTAALPTLKLGQWSQWTIEAKGNHIIVSIDGNEVVDYIDRSMSSKLRSGEVALYTEDARVAFDNVHLARHR